MKSVKISARDWESSSNRFTGNRDSESYALGQSDFPPSFWMSRGVSSVTVSRARMRVMGIPVAYPLIVGLVLTVAFLLQKLIMMRF